MFGDRVRRLRRSTVQPERHDEPIADVGWAECGLDQGAGTGEFANV
jgi:hypothetical protein